MRKIIIYRGKHGAVKSVADMVKESSNNIDTHDILNGEIDITKYQTVIIGTNVTASKISKELKIFCNESILLDKSIIIFISGINNDISEVVKQNFSEELIKKTKHIIFVGGKLNFPDMNFMERSIIKMVNKKEKIIDNIDTKKEYDFLNYENINKMITIINNLS